SRLGIKTRLSAAIILERSERNLQNQRGSGRMLVYIIVFVACYDRHVRFRLRVSIQVIQIERRLALHKPSFAKSPLERACCAFNGSDVWPALCAHLDYPPSDQFDSLILKQPGFSQLVIFFACPKMQSRLGEDFRLCCRHNYLHGKLATGANKNFSVWSPVVDAS